MTPGTGPTLTGLGILLVMNGRRLRQWQTRFQTLGAAVRCCISDDRSERAAYPLLQQPSSLDSVDIVCTDEVEFHRADDLTRMYWLADDELPPIVCLMDRELAHPPEARTLHRRRYLPASLSDEALCRQVWHTLGRAAP